MKRFYAPKDSFAGSTVTLDQEETRHLRDVLRSHIGDEVSVFDGAGGEFLCKITEIGKKASVLTILSETRAASPESGLDLTLAAAMLKGEKFDLVVQKAVELGVTHLVPLATQRCDVRLKDTGKRVDRWRRIALEATKQSGRATLMQVSEPVAYDKLIAYTSPENTFLFSERDGARFSTIQTRGKLTAIIGPEGGWDDHELDAARLNGILIVTLGGRTMRAETAAISIAAILQHSFGDLN